MPNPQLRLLASADLPLAVSAPAALVVLEGAVTVCTGTGDRWPARRGDVVAVRNGPPVELRPTEAGVRLAALLLDEAWAREVADLVLPGESLAGEPGLCIEAAQTEAGRRLAELVSGSWWGAQRPAGSRAVAVLEHIARARSAPDRARPRAHRVASRLVRLLEEMGREEGAGWSLAELAGRLGVSERQASRLFRRETGRSFREARLELRIERARKLLLTTDDPIVEIAYAAGWGSLSQFHQAFRRAVGRTPATFRETSRSAPERAEAG